MANIDKTVERIEKERIKHELQIVDAKLSSIAFVKLSESGTHYIFVDKNGKNVFEDTDMLKKEFGFPAAENENEALFVIKASDAGDKVKLVVPKAGEIAVGELKPNKEYLKMLVKTSIAPLPVKERRQARTTRQQSQAQTKNVVSK